MASTEHDDDQPLSAVASAPIQASAFMTDSTRPLQAAAFDIEGFIGGMRPTRRTIKLHERADLIGVMDELAQRIDDTPEDDDSVDELIDRFVAARDTFYGAVAYWTVEKRTSEWVTDRWAAYAKAHNIALNKDGDTTNMKHRLELMIDQLVGQLVEVTNRDGKVIAGPGDVTHERLRQMYDTNEGELNKLMFAMTDANTSIAMSAKVLARDFSPRYSTSRSGATS